MARDMGLAQRNIIVWAFYFLVSAGAVLLGALNLRNPEVLARREIPKSGWNMRARAGELRHHTFLGWVWIITGTALMLVGLWALLVLRNSA